MTSNPCPRTYDAVHEELVRLPLYCQGISGGCRSVIWADYRAFLGEGVVAYCPAGVALE